MSNKPLAIHGTSREAINNLFNEGVLPAKGHESEYPEMFYFTPVSRWYDLSPYALRVGKFTFSQALSSGKFYAQVYSWDHYLVNTLGRLPDEWGGQADTIPNHCRWFEYEFKKKRGDPEVRRFVEDMWKRKGYLIEPNELLFEKFHYRRGDDPTVIAVRCPDGLPIECIKSVVPLGLEEKILLKKLANNRIK